MKSKKKRTVANHVLRLPPRLTVLLLASFFAVVCVCALFLIKSKEFVFESARPFPHAIKTEVAETFPIGVDPRRKVIVENTQVDAYLENHIVTQAKRTPHDNWFDKTLAFLTQFDWYQNLASPISRILVINSGERKEEILHNFSNILRWSSDDTARFASLIADSSPEMEDGKFTPGRYVVNKDATPEEVATMLLDQFDTQVLSRYPAEVSEVVPLQDALSIASLLEREAYDFEDMRYISGIIWNRLFSEMHLQLDASLQYAKADQGGSVWWPKVLPEDKYINSPFNTYKHAGLPPAPIANPSSEAILAALNPRDTDCIFYFHDADGGFHCTVSYEEHVELLREIYGQGQ